MSTINYVLRSCFLIFIFTFITTSEVQRIQPPQKYNEEVSKLIRPADAVLEVNSDVNADELWSIFFKDTLPDGITNLTVKVVGEDSSYGAYSNMPTLSNIDLEDGIILTTGSAKNAIGPNNYGATQTVHQNEYFDNDLEILSGQAIPVNGHLSKDALSFEITFSSDTTVKGFSFDFVFGSEEYPEYVGQQYNDVVAVFVDGKNALYDKNDSLVSINNALFDIDNSDSVVVNLQYDGFTSPLKCSDTLIPGDHIIRFAISDISDAQYDSGIFLNSFKFDYIGKGIQIVKVEDQEMTVEHGTTEGTVVDTIDLLINSDVTLTIIDQNPEVHFDLEDNIIKVKNGITINYFDITDYELKVVADNGDGYPDTAKIIINVLLNIKNENLINDQTFNILENSEPLTIVGEISKVHDSNAIQYELISINPNDDFYLDGKTIKLKENTTLDFESNNTYNMTIVASLNGFVSDTAIITINVIDYVIDNLINDQTFNVNENIDVGTIIGQIELQSTQNIKVSIETVNSNPTGIIQINNLDVETSGLIDYETIQTVTLTVVATADEAISDTAIITVNINDLFDPHKVNDSYYSDIDANGVVDRVDFYFERDIKSDENISVVLKWIDENFVSDTLSLEKDIKNAKHLYVDVSDAFNANVASKTSGKMIANIINGVVNVNVRDNAAPVVVYARYLRGGELSKGSYNDTLVTSFSEDIIKIESQIPLEFKSEDNHVYHLNLLPLVYGNKQVVFDVLSSVEGVWPEKGDSVHIDVLGKVTDTEDNIQENIKNRYVMMTIRDIPFNLTVKSVGPVSPNDYKIPDEIIQSENISQSEGVLITIVPHIKIDEELLEEIKFELNIFDAVGNIVNSKLIDQNNPDIEKSIIKNIHKPYIAVVWSGKNKKGRYVASGSYLYQIKIFNNNENEVIEKGYLLIEQ